MSAWCPTLLLPLVLCYGRSVAATEARSPTPDAAAQLAFRAGVDAARQEHWEEALAEFQKAYDLSPRPVVLMNLAGAQVHVGQLREAAKNYRRILDEPASGDNAAFRRAASEVLPSLEARIPHIRLRSAGLTPSDTVKLDAQPIAAEALGADLTLDPGEHTLIVERGGIERARVLFTLAEREVRQIGVPLPAPAPTPSGLAGLAALGQPAAPAPPPAATRRWWTSPWTWGIGGVVVASASIAVVALLARRDQAFSGNVPPGRIVVH